MLAAVALKNVLKLSLISIGVFRHCQKYPKTCDHGDFPDGTQRHDMLGDEIAGQFAGKHPDEPLTTYCDRALVQHHTM
jgi:hypothetical protein